MSKTKQHRFNGTGEFGMHVQEITKEDIMKEIFKSEQALIATADWLESFIPSPDFPYGNTDIKVRRFPIKEISSYLDIKSPESIGIASLVSFPTGRLYLPNLTYLLAKTKLGEGFAISAPIPTWINKQKLVFRRNRFYTPFYREGFSEVLEIIAKDPINPDIRTLMYCSFLSKRDGIIIN